MDEGIRSRLAAGGAPPSNLRSFGLILSAVLSLAGWLAALKDLGAWPWLLGLALGLFPTALLRPLWLLPVERRWMDFARVLAWVNTRVVLALIYYLVLTPYGLILRAVSGDPLDREWEKTPSYWKPLRTGEDLAAYERIF